MTKLYPLALLVILFSLLLIGPVSAAGFQDELQKQSGAFTGAQGAGLGKAQDPRAVVAKLIRNALGFVGILFVAYTVYAGFLILTSHGEEEKIMAGKKTLRTAVIGVLISLSAYSIVHFVNKTLLRATEERPAFDAYIETETRQFNPCAEGRGDALSCGR